MNRHVPYNQVISQIQKQSPGDILQKLFCRTVQIFRENTCTGVSFLTKLQDYYSCSRTEYWNILSIYFTGSLRVRGVFETLPNFHDGGFLQK